MKKLLLSIALLTLFSLARAQEPVAAGSELDNAILDAVTCIDAGDYKAAGAALDSLAAIYPENDAVRYYQGLCSYSAGKYNTAAAQFGEALALDPSNDWYKETLANLYLGLGQVDAADKLLRELQAAKPGKFPELYVSQALASAYRIGRNYPAYFECLTRIVRDDVADDETKYEALMSVLGNFDSRTYNALLPSIDTLCRAYAAAEPSSMHAHSLCMQMAAGLGDNPRVIDECNVMMNLQPEDTTNTVTCLSIIGDTYHSMGNSRMAYKTYEQALKLNPEYCPVLNNYAYYLSLEKRRLAKAENMSLVTVTKEPDNPTYLDTYAWILYLRGKAAEAKPYFKHAMLYGGKDSAVILMHYALVLEKLGEKDLASYYRNLAESKSK